MALLPLPLVIAIGSLVLSGLAGRIASRPRLIAGPLAVAAGFPLLLRIGGHNAHGSTVLPGTFVAALGMAYAVAPLTSAAVGSVDERYSSLAQGFNTAVARAGARGHELDRRDPRRPWLCADRCLLRRRRRERGRLHRCRRRSDAKAPKRLNAGSRPSAVGPLDQFSADGFTRAVL